jgi:5-methylthioadenosine/S-adenosylhomocysteine deaminase
MHDPIANLVSAMHSEQIESVMCDGRWLLHERKILTINEEEVIHEARRTASKILSRSGIQLPQRFPRAD